MPEERTIFANEKSSHNMTYGYLGKTGLKVSHLCLGAMTFSVSGQGPFGNLPAAAEEESHAILDAFVKAGGNFIDTADCYGESEECIGRWLAKKEKSEPGFRKRLVIATKVRMQLDDGRDPNAVGISRKHIFDQLETSLQRLQTTYVDLYQVHCWDAGTPVRETLGALNTLIQQGKVRYIGASNYNAWHLVEAEAIAAKHNWEPYVTVQNQYSLLARQVELSVTEVCQRYGGIGILPWSPLTGGLLSGKYKKGQNEPDANSRAAWADAAGWDATSFKAQQGDKLWSILDELEKVAKELGTSVAAVALRWLVQQPTVSSVIIGAKSVKQLEENLKAAEIKLSADQVERLSKVSDLGNKPYPWSIIEMTNAGRGRQTASYPLA